MLGSKEPRQAPAGSNVPFGIFSPSFPGQVVDGTEDSGKVVAPSAGFRADCLFRQVRGRYCCVHYVVVNFLPYEGILGWIQRKIQSYI